MIECQFVLVARPLMLIEGFLDSVQFHGLCFPSIHHLHVARYKTLEIQGQTLGVCKI